MMDVDSHINPSFEQTAETTDSNGIKVKDQGNKEYLATSHLQLKSTGSVELDFFSSPRKDRIYAVLFSNVNTKTFKGSYLKIFHSAVFKDHLMWVCGWNRNIIFGRETILLGVKIPSYNVVRKRRKRTSKADLPTFMICI